MSRRQRMANSESVGRPFVFSLGLRETMATEHLGARFIQTFGGTLVFIFGPWRGHEDSLVRSGRLAHAARHSAGQARHTESQ